MKNLLVVIAGAVITLIILGFVSGIIPTWIKERFLVEPTKTEEVKEPSPTPSPSPKASLEPEKGTWKPTSKGGLTLGAATSNPSVSSISYATIVYEYKEKDSNIWIIRANYDTRYENYIDFDEVSLGYDRKVTICLYGKSGQIKCENGSIDLGIHTTFFVVNGKSLVYEIKSDTHGPSMSFEGPWKNNDGKTCVRVIGIKDDITPSTRITTTERIDQENFRELHSEYCISGGDKHEYQVRARDERGNETTNTFAFSTN